MTSSKNIIAAAQIKNELASMHNELEKLVYIGSGNHGHAYKLGKSVVKITTDLQEAKVAAHLKDCCTKYVAKVYEVFRFYSKSQDRECFFIFMELLHTSPDQKEKIQQALSDYKTVWFIRFGDSMRRGFNFWDLCQIYRDNNLQILSKVRDMLIKDLTNGNDSYHANIKYNVKERLTLSLDFFDFIQKAYEELLQIYSNGRIDLNEGNFMFDSGERLKCFDFQQYDPSKD